MTQLASDQNRSELEQIVVWLDDLTRRIAEDE